MDRLLPDLLRSISRNIALHGHDRGRAGCGDVASLSLGILILLSIPTMFAATGYTLFKSLRGKGENPIGVSQIDAHGWLVLAIGFVVSYIVAYASVAWFMGYVRKRGFAPFAVYRIIVGALVLVFASRLAG